MGEKGVMTCSNSPLAGIWTGSAAYVACALTTWLPARPLLLVYWRLASSSTELDTRAPNHDQKVHLSWWTVPPLVCTLFSTFLVWVISSVAPEHPECWVRTQTFLFSCSDVISDCIRPIFHNHCVSVPPLFVLTNQKNKIPAGAARNSQSMITKMTKMTLSREHTSTKTQWSLLPAVNCTHSVDTANKPTSRHEKVFDVSDMSLIPAEKLL